MRILVFGGTGFIGRHCVKALRRSADNFDVVAVSRRSSADVVCDLCLGIGSDESLCQALEGADLVVNCVGIKRSTAEQDWEDAHVRSVSRLLSAMRTAGVGRLVHVTVAGLSPLGQTDPYSVTKLASETAVRAAAAAKRHPPLSAYIIRPAVVWGRGDDFSRNLAGGILHAPAFPSPAPSGRIAVVHVEDVADAVVAAVAELLEEDKPQQGASVDAAGGGCGGSSKKGSVRCADVRGPEELTLPELLGRTAEALGLYCLSVPVPAPLMVPAAWVVERLMTDPPITTAQLGLLRRGVVGDLTQTTALLGRAPRRYTADGCREAVAGLVKPLFGVSVRPRWLLGQEVQPLLRPD